MFEITEYNTTVCNHKKIRNTDLIDVFGSKLGEAWSAVKIEPY